MLSNFYQPFKHSDMYTKHGNFQPEIKPKMNNVPTLESMRERLNLDELKKRLGDPTSISFNNIAQNSSESKLMKEALIKGSKNILKGIYPSTTNTIYQECFKGSNNTYRLDNKTDFFTSGIKGQIPDPYEMKRMKNNREIHSALKSNVKNMLYKDLLYK